MYPCNQSVRNILTQCKGEDFGNASPYIKRQVRIIKTLQEYRQHGFLELEQSFARFSTEARVGETADQRVYRAFILDLSARADRLPHDFRRGVLQEDIQKAT